MSDEDATNEQKIAGHAETVKLEVVAKAAAWDEVRGLLPRLIDELDGLRKDIRDGRYREERHERREQSLSRMIHVPTTVACLAMIIISLFAYYTFIAEPRSRAVNARIARIESTTTTTTSRPPSVTTTDTAPTNTTSRVPTGSSPTTTVQRNGSSGAPPATNAPSPTTAPGPSADTVKPGTTTSTGILCPRAPIC